METIIKRLCKDDEFLAAILQTSYFTWQQKYLQILVKLGNVFVPRKKLWQTRDIILLVKNELPKIHLVAALMRHSKEPGTDRYLLNEKEILQLGKLMAQQEENFVDDLFRAVEHLPQVIKERAYKFVYTIDPNQHSLVPLGDPFLGNLSLGGLSMGGLSLGGLSMGNFHQDNSVLDSIGMSIQINPQPLIPIFKSISDFFSNHIKVTTNLNYIESSFKSTMTNKEFMITEVNEE